MTALTPILTVSLGLAVGADHLTVLNAETADGKPSQVFYRHLQEEIHAALDDRLQEFEALEIPEQIRAFQQRRREFFVKQLGGFPTRDWRLLSQARSGTDIAPESESGGRRHKPALPARTPLNAKTVGRMEGDGYCVEKVIFDSQPGHRITATLYLPDAKPPYPGVVVASGHSRTAKAAGYNQRFGIIMAQHGMAALCYDPIGQGERSQILTDEGKPKHQGTTTEHFLMGVGSILVGRNTARYRIFDGMRAIDYLADREEIDPERIGFTGCSGGGTLTSYVMALDDRVACAAPSCYLTTFRRLVDTIGPQDAEQNIFGQIAFGMDQPDYVLMRAPKPTFISATTEDFFDIAGTWENFRQSKRIYTILGHPERVNLVEGPGGHGVPMTNLNAIARWMSRWLLQQDADFTESEIPVRETDELQCTPNGQVLLLPGEKSVFDLNAEYEQELAKRRAAWQNNTSPEKQRKKVRELAGIRSQDELPTLEVRKVDRLQRDGYHIDKLVLHCVGRVPLPALSFVPENPKNRQGEAYLYLHGGGKSTDAQRGGPIERLVKQGRKVLAVDVSGLGETRRSDSDGLLGDWKNYYMAYLLGQSVVGIRAEDTLLAAQFLSADGDGKRRSVHLVGIGEAALPALHAAAVEPELFATVRLRGMIRSWRDVVRASETRNQLVHTVHGALEYYDLPDLIELARQNGTTVAVEAPVTVMGQPVSD